MGAEGVEAVTAPYVVIVDVLRFTTAVDAAVARRVRVHPYRWKGESAAAFAQRVGASLAGDGDATGPSFVPRNDDPPAAWRGGGASIAERVHVRIDRQ